MTKFRSSHFWPRGAALSAAVAVALALPASAEARNLVNETLNIDGTTPTDTYNVGWISNLISDGATTGRISVGPSGTLTATRTTVTSATDTAVSVGGGKATIADSTIVSTDGAGIAASATNIPSGDDAGRHETPSVSVMRSNVTGTFAGATLAGAIGANLTLQNSTLTGSDASSTGVWVLGGTMVSQGSTIKGGDDGLRIRTDKIPSDPLPTFIQSNITLTDGTIVKGNTGSGIFVERGADATIRVLNGSTVTGGNGTLLEVVGNSTVNFSAAQTTLAGDIAVESGSQVDVALQSGSVISGAMQGVRGVTVSSGGQWNQTASSSIGTLDLDGGTLQLGDGATFNTLTVAGNYTANNGNLIIYSVLGDDASPGDRLVVQGDTAGSTNVRVINVGGAGAQTANGIQVVQVDGASNGTFALSGRAVGGLYDYFLFKGGKADPNDGDWYLRSQLQTPPDPCLADPSLPSCQIVIPDPCEIDPSLPQCGPVVPVLRPEPGAYLANLRSAEMLFRTDYHSRHAGQNHGRGWARVDGNRNSYDALNRQLDITGNSQALHVGVDIISNEAGSGFGVMLASGNATSTTKSNLTAYSARGKVRGEALGVYGTIRALGTDDPYEGLYVDGWVQRQQFRNKVEGDGLTTERYDSKAWQGSVEAGYAFRVTGDAARGGIYLEPQLQVGYTDMNSDTHIEENGTIVEAQRAGGMFARAGLRLSGVSRWAGTAAQVQPYLKADWLYNKREEALLFDNELVDNRIPASRLEIGAGASIKFAAGFGAWAGLAIQHASEYHSTSAQLGMSYSW